MSDTNTNEQDRSQELDFTPVEGEKPVPLGWRLLFWGLIAFGAVYLWLFSPWSTGWTQAGELDRAGDAAAGAGGNIFATILFTTLAVIAAVIILVAVARRKKQP